MDTTTLVRPPRGPHEPASGRAPVTRRARDVRARPTLPADWMVVASIALFPVMWLLGIAGFIFQLVSVVMLFHLVLQRRRVVVPWPVPLFVGFLIAAAASAIMIDDPGRMLAYLWRMTNYVGLTIWFVWFYNSTIPDLGPRVVRCIAWWFVGIVLLGFAAMAAPDFEFASPVETLVPAGLLANEFLYSMVHLKLAQVHDFLSSPIPRPTAPFFFANSWGSGYTIGLPMFVLALSRARGRWRTAGSLFLVASVVPLLVSVNRSAWATLLLGVAFAATRLARRGRTTFLLMVIVGSLVVAAVILASPLADLIVERFAANHSDEGRANTYSQVLSELASSPLLGFGTPRPNANPNLPSLGTQGILWTVVFSHGFVAVVLFVGFYVSLFLKSLRARSEFGIWGSAALLIAILQFVVYDFLPTELFVVTAIGALLLREVDRERAGVRVGERRHAIGRGGLLDGPLIGSGERVQSRSST